MKTSFPIWDARAASILLDDGGSEIWLDELDIRRLIGSQQLGVHRRRDVRKIYLKGNQEAVFPRSLRKVDMPQPCCVKVPVSDICRVYQHVAHRCEGYYDGRAMPLDETGNPRPWQIQRKCL